LSGDPSLFVGFLGAEFFEQFFLLVEEIVLVQFDVQSPDFELALNITQVLDSLLHEIDIILRVLRIHLLFTVILVSIPQKIAPVPYHTNPCFSCQNRLRDLRLQRRDLVLHFVSLFSVISLCG